MKRTKQTIRGNVTGSRSTFSGPVPVASVPRHEPHPRHFRRALRALKRYPIGPMPKWAVMSYTLDYMFRRVNLMVSPETGSY